jgi:ribonuclease HI
MKIEIFTDGACSGNPGPGGWSAMVRCNDGVYKTLSGFDPNTTNNRMELLGVIHALAFARVETNGAKSEITLTTDSKYVVDAINQNWLTNWRQNGWRTAGKKPVKNQDLWEQLLPWITDPEHAVTFKWVKGHAGHFENELCDQLAVAEIENNIKY